MMGLIIQTHGILKKKLGWHSILIEPQPSVFLNFKKKDKNLKQYI